MTVESEIITKHLLTSDEKLEKWGYGEWVEEPDELTWDYRGFRCKIRRMFSGAGQLNGYIQILPNHPWFEKNYDEIDVEVHGGLTFAGISQDPAAYWIGFDCMHWLDIAPGFLRATVAAQIEIDLFFQEGPKLKRSYKNIAFVKAECESMVDQAIAAQLQNKQIP